MKNTALLLMLLFLLPSIGHATPKYNQLEIFVTLPPLAGLVSWLDPSLRIQCLLPNNADPHHFQLTPRQIQSLQNAKLLVRSPRDDKFWPIFNTQTSIFSLWDIQKHIHDEPNHAWLNPFEVQAALPYLAQELIKRYPAHKQTIESNLNTQLKNTKAIWQLWLKVIKDKHLKERGIIMQHPSWQGLFEALGVPVRAVLESAQHGQEQGPRKLEHALRVLKKHPQTLLIADAHHSNRSLNWLKKHNPTSHIITLDALGKCGQAWPKLMQHNLDILAGHKP